MIGTAGHHARLLTSAVVFFGVFAATELVAAERGRGAHGHGVSRLTLAAEGDRVELRLEAPGADIAGFEHMARSAEDRATVRRAAGYLGGGDKLFTFPAAAQCRLQAADVESPLSAGEIGHDTGHTYRGCVAIRGAGRMLETSDSRWYLHQRLRDGHHHRGLCLSG